MEGRELCPCSGCSAYSSRLWDPHIETPLDTPVARWLHSTTLYYITLRCTTLHYTLLHYTTLHFTTLHYTTPHYTKLHGPTLHYITPHYTKLHGTTLHFRSKCPFKNLKTDCTVGPYFLEMLSNCFQKVHLFQLCTTLHYSWLPDTNKSFKNWATTLLDIVQKCMSLHK